MLKSFIDSMKPRTLIDYRADIDGLRAVAIIAVVLFHAFPTAFPGGFVGVDVFFVLSGFLITEIIRKAVSDSRFTAKDFYFRRARRLLPALTVVFIAVATAAPFFLFAPEIVLLGKHILSGLLFTSNLRLVHESGYFDTDSAAKPLLNLWSLGVEEQFYLIWPWLMLLCFRLRKPFSYLVIPAILLSFVVNIWLVYHHARGVFYLPHVRFWELVFGATVALINAQKIRALHDSKPVRSALSSLGLILIGTAFFLCSATDPYPGFWALLPVVGTTAIIVAGPSSFLNRFLALPLFVFIGYLSYAIYLWHWPVLSYLHIVTFGESSVLARWVAVAISFALATVTFLALELPIRKGRMSFNGRDVLFIFVGVALLAVALEKIGPQINQLPKSLVLHEDMRGLIREHDCLIPTSEQRGKDAEYCLSDNREKPTLAVWGDSKADAIFAGLVPESSPGARWLVMGRSGCGPLTGVQRGFYSGEMGEGCTRSNRLMLKTLIDHSEIRTVLVTTADRVLTVPTYTDANDSSKTANPNDALIRSLRELTSAGKRVLFLIDNPTLADPEKCVARPWSHKVDPNAECSISVEEFRKRTPNLSEIRRRISTEVPSVEIIDATDAICPNGVCKMVLDGRFLYGFSDHLSDTGSRMVARRILQQISHPAAAR